jgi:phenylpyruvate tautomerase PptA (4-oxalocrotonate tautomerase family)
MPIIDIETVGDAPPDPAGTHAAARELADRIGAILGSAPSGTWVRLRHLPRNAYAENGGEVPPDVRPTFVRVLLARLPERNVLRTYAASIASAVAAALGRPAENVHVLFEPPAAGRIAFGGRLTEE